MGRREAASPALACVFIKPADKVVLPKLEPEVVSAQRVKAPLEPPSKITNTGAEHVEPPQHSRGGGGGGGITTLEGRLEFVRKSLLAVFDSRVAVQLPTSSIPTPSGYSGPSV